MGTSLDYHISEATEPYIQESSGENGSLNDLEYDDVTIGMVLSSPLFTQVREDDASRRRANHSQDEGLSSSQSSSVSHKRTVRLVNEQPPSLFTQHTDRFIVDDDDMDSDTVAESDMSLISRSFLHRVNDRVRKIQDQSSKDATWRMCMSSTLGASFFMGKNYSDNWHSIKNTEDLTMEQMFEISEQLILEQSDEVEGMSTINWEHSSWKYLSLTGDEEVVSLLHTKVYVFSDSVLCLGKMSENP